MPARLALSVVWILGMLVGGASFQRADAQDRGEALATRLPAVDREARMQEDAEAAGTIGPRRFGVVRTVNVTPASHGVWTTEGRTDVWRHVVTAANARGLALTWALSVLPDGATFTVEAPDGSPRHGPYTAAHAPAGRLTTPLVSGDSLLITLRVPRTHRNALDVRIDRVTHAYRLPLAANPRPQSKSGACNVDVACPAGDDWHDAIRSVALLTYTQGGSASFCTGSLVNNTAGDGRPFFLTAEHCISTPETAETAVFYWNFQNSTCRPPGSPASGDPSDDDRLEESSTGAVLRARYGNVHDTGFISGRPDLSLLEITDPDGLGAFGVYFNGWDVSGTAPATGTSIHHPDGDAKRIAIDEDPLTRTAYGLTSPSSADTHWLIEAWEVGTTEGGSSGAPLYDPNGRVVGVLSGGAAGCTGRGTDNDRPDWYGALAAGFEQTDYGTATFRDWLDPTGSGVASLDGADLTALPVELAAFTATVDGSGIHLRWTTASETTNAGFRLAIAPANGTFAPVDAFVPGAGTTDRPTTYRHHLRDLLPGRYRIRLTQVDADGHANNLRTVRATVRATAAVQVRPPHPHPMRTAGHAVFTVRQAQPVRAVLYDALGRAVARPFDARAQAGQPYRLALPADRLSPGPYFLHLTGPHLQHTERIVVVR